MKNDKDLGRQVQKALSKDVALKSNINHIKIFVNDGTVVLSGTVSDYPTKSAIKKVVAETTGVIRVSDDLRVESPNPDRVGVFFDWTNGSMVISH